MRIGKERLEVGDAARRPPCDLEESRHVCVGAVLVESDDVTARAPVLGDLLAGPNILGRPRRERDGRHRRHADEQLKEASQGPRERHFIGPILSASRSRIFWKMASSMPGPTAQACPYARRPSRKSNSNIKRTVIFAPSSLR